MNRKKILIVDDNQVVLKALSLALQKHEFDVITALDGTEAVGLVRREKPDLIVLDISFPGDFSAVQWDGFKIMQWLRRVEEAKQVPFIVITGGEPSKYRDRALREGASAFFQKPINNDDLVVVVRRLIAERQEKAAQPDPELTT